MRHCDYRHFAGPFVPGYPAGSRQADLVSCKNNLKQIGLALTAYDNYHKHLPPGGTRGGAGCSAHLLPYLEQENVYNALWTGADPVPQDFYAHADGRSDPKQYQWFDYGAALDAAAAQIPVYLCPSADYHPEFTVSLATDSGQLLYPYPLPTTAAFNPKLSNTSILDFGRTNYLGVAGAEYGTLQFRDANQGLLYCYSKVSPGASGGATWSQQHVNGR